MYVCCILIITISYIKLAHYIMYVYFILMLLLRVSCDLTTRLGLILFVQLFAALFSSFMKDFCL